eukprot:jgi/Pico_ML_1/54352/g4713.t1
MAQVGVDFAALEDADGVRFAWNVWPDSKVEATKCVVPLAALWSPGKDLPNMPCRCGAMLNPFARVDFPSKLWICPFCHMRNHFPPHYASICETNLPAELFPNYCTVEYTMQQRTAEPPAYLLVIDTGLAEDELDGLKTALGQALSLMPENAQARRFKWPPA